MSSRSALPISRRMSRGVLTTVILTMLMLASVAIRSLFTRRAALTGPRPVPWRAADRPRAEVASILESQVPAGGCYFKAASAMTGGAY